MLNRPAVLEAANTVSGGAISSRIAELAAQRHTYESIASAIAEEFGVKVSRDTVRRWLLAEGLTPATTEAAS